ncbi:MAG: hypothetical protein KME29_15525 [Calothrix sp. FI2-JRJ7]|jgi:uncharacterized membrane protein YcjF (UPF0283 family)|nr:hypothetical protein [Calothrix sp. FI2-JRJ7]
MTQDKQNAAPEENVLIKVNNQVSNEKTLSTSSAINEIVFTCLIIVFSTALLAQILSIIPASYKLRDILPTLTFTILGVFIMLLYVLKKKPTLKTYLYILSFLIGALLGV